MDQETKYQEFEGRNSDVYEREIENVPELRFPCFVEKWNKTKLKNICNINKGKQLNKSNMVENGKYYVLNGGKVPSGYTDSWNVKENTITISEGGNSCGFVSYNKEKFYCGGHCFYISNLNSKINNYYLFHFLKQKEEKIMSLRVGSGLPNIQKKDLINFSIEYPDIKEQEKIACFLSKLDEKIMLLEKKQEYQKIVKKYLLENLMSYNLRFKEFKLNNNFEIKKLSEIGEFYSGLSGKNKEDFSKEGNAKFITYKSIFDNDMIDESFLECVFINNDEKQNKVKENDLFFTMSSETPSDVGMTSILGNSVKNCYLNSFCSGYRLNTNSNVKPIFLNYYLKSPNSRKHIAKLAQGSTRFNLPKKEPMLSS